MRLLILCVALATVISCLYIRTIDARPVDLRVDRRENLPWFATVSASQQSGSILQGIESTHPTFSWAFAVDSIQQGRNIHQASYRLVVREIGFNARQAASSPDNNIWCDTGVVASAQSLHVRCDQVVNGKSVLKALKSDTTYEWSVQLVDNTGVESDWVSARFHTAFVPPNAFSGTWIGGGFDNPMNELRKDFNLPKPVLSANVFISGIGYYQLYVNGKNVDPSRKLDPAWTTFEKRVLYAAHDVTYMLSAGANTIGIQLGNGWYSQQQYAVGQQEPSYGPPRVLFQMNVTFTDGTKTTIQSDASSGWTGRQGAILLDGVYDGEKYDARLERPGWNLPGFRDNASVWFNAVAMPAPGGVISSQLLEPVRITNSFKPISITSPFLATYLVDFGQNFSGWVRFNVTGKRGTAVQIKHAEVLEEGGGIYSQTIYIDNLRSAAATDIYILKGTSTGEQFEPRFTVHGFRYVLLSTLPNGLNAADIEGIVVHSAVKSAGNVTFPTQPILNGVQHMVQWGQRTNMMSLPTDCHQRDERKGWMGDAGLTVDESMFNFNGMLFYEKFLRDIADIQGSDGTVTDTVPFTFGSRPADPAWGTAYPTIVYMHYNHYGDADIVKTHYAGVKAFVDYEAMRANQSGLAKMFYNYGDWVPPAPETATDPHLCAAFSFMNDVNSLIFFAGLLGNSADKAYYSGLYQNLTVEFHTAFYNPNITGYADGKQTANALALYLPGVVPANLKTAVASSLLKDIVAHNNHLTTGIIGTRFLMLTLSQVLNRTDVALSIATQTTYPSWGYMVANSVEPATTLWEEWNTPDNGPGMDSRNHIMFGSVGAWFYRELAGINPNALKEIIIHPKVAGISNQLQHVNAKYVSLKGPIVVNWAWSTSPSTTAAKLSLHVEIPPNTHAKVYIPHTDPLHGQARQLLESNTLLWTQNANEVVLPEGILAIRTNVVDNVFELHVTSGSYDFMAAYN